MNIKKVYIVFMIFLSTLFLLTSCKGLDSTGIIDTKSTRGKDVDTSTGKKVKIKVLTSNLIIKKIIDKYNTENVFQVETLTNTKKELEEFKVGKDFLNGKDYKAFYYIGATYEPFLSDILESVDKNTVQIVNISRGIELLRVKKDGIDSDNPYYLTNTTNFKIALFNIKNSLQELDPPNASKYDVKFEEMTKDLDKTESQMKDVGIDLKKYRVLFEDQNLEYILHQMKTEAVSIDEYLENYRKKASDEKPIVLLYYSSKALSKLGTRLQSNNIKLIKMNLYSDELSIYEMQNQNLENLNKAINLKDKVAQY